MQQFTVIIKMDTDMVCKGGTELLYTAIIVLENKITAMVQ